MNPGRRSNSLSESVSPSVDGSKICDEWKKDTDDEKSPSFPVQSEAEAVRNQKDDFEAKYKVILSQWRSDPNPTPGSGWGRPPAPGSNPPMNSPATDSLSAAGAEGGRDEWYTYYYVIVLEDPFGMVHKLR